MSVRAMTAVWDLDLPDSDKIVLLALADCANDEGHCWPSVASLVRKCTKSERTIQGAIKRLVDAGHLTRREVIGKGCNYTVHPNRGSPRSDSAPAITAPPQGTTKTPAAAADKPSRTVNTEAKASYKAAFDFWDSLCPRSGLPVVKVINNSRKQAMNARIKEHGLDRVKEAIANVHASLFCRGLRGSGRKADINFILQPATFARALEGYYGEDDQKPQRLPAPDDRASLLQRAAFYDSINQADNAAECRRRAALVDASPSVGAVAAKIFEEVRTQ